jgi:hypothetical protein
MALVPASIEIEDRSKEISNAITKTDNNAYETPFLFWFSPSFAPSSGPSDTTCWMCQKCACVFPTMDLSEVCQHVLIVRDRFPLHFLHSREIQ